MLSVDLLDAAAEREAASIAALSAMTDTDVPQDRRVVLGRMVQMAMEMGLKPKARPRYPRAKVTQWWEGVCASLKAGTIPKLDRELPLTSFDRERLARRRKMLGECRALSAISDRTYLTIPEAAKLSGLAARTLQRHCQEGRIKCQRRFNRHASGTPGKGTFYVNAGSIRQYLSRRFGPVAA
jgi:hypothetical protein